MSELKTSYTFNYIKIYFWQFLAAFLSMVSMFIVMPKLTTNPKIYGIYCICTSVNIFLGYADLGFISAGIKYASEFFAQNNRDEESKIISFSCFVLFVLLLLFSIIIFIFSYNPHLLIKDIGAALEKDIASKLLFVLAVFTPTFVLQKMLNIIFYVRLEDYIYSRINIIFSILKIVSIFYFFNAHKYDIVGYYLFFNILNIISYIVGFILIKKRYNYSLRTLLKNFHFSNNVFYKIKGLAFSSLYLTLIWVLFNEIDMFIIAKILGGESTAFYGVALMITNFLKLIYGTIYGPYVARINHFVGLKDEHGFKNFISKSIFITIPLVIFPVLSVAIFSKNITYTWVGDKYLESVFILTFLSLSYLHSFISYISGSVLLAKEKLKELNFFSLFQPILYWVVIAIFLKTFGIKAFAIAKCCGWLYMTIFYFVMFTKLIDVKPIAFISKLISKIGLPLVAFLFLELIIVKYLPDTKSKFNLVKVIFAGAMTSGIAISIYYFTCIEFKIYIDGVFEKVRIRFYGER